MNPFSRHPLACPHCNLVDRVQKITALDADMLIHALPLLVEPGPPPTRPIRSSDWDIHKRTELDPNPNKFPLGIQVLNGLGCLVMVAAVWGGIALATTAPVGVILIPVGIVLGIIILLPGRSYNIRMKDAIYQQALQDYTARMQEYLTRKQDYESKIEWSSILLAKGYYCPRCGISYVP